MYYHKTNTEPEGVESSAGLLSVNARFNRQLAQQIAGTLPKGIYTILGIPMTY